MTVKPPNHPRRIENSLSPCRRRGDESQISRFSGPIHGESQSLLTSAPTIQTGSKQLPVVWQDSVWFPTVGRFRSPPRRPVNWPVQIITDPTVCLGRAFSLIKL